MAIEMRRVSSVFLILILGGLSLHCAAGKRAVVPETPAHVGGPPLSRSQMVRELDALLSDTLFQISGVGVRVVNLANGEVVYEHAPRRLFHPASNMKLFTTAAALVHLGPNFRFVTRAAVDTGVTVGDTLRSNLYLIGAGDPELSFGDLAEIVEQLAARGVRFIDGDIVCDDTFLDSLWYGNGWMWDEGSSEDFSPIGALTVDDNTVEIHALPADSLGGPARVWMVPRNPVVQIVNESRTASPEEIDSLRADSTAAFEPFRIERRWQDRVNIVDVRGWLPSTAGEQVEKVNIVQPSLYFGRLFREICRRQGIGVRGRVFRGAAPDTFRVVAWHVSPPLLDLLVDTNKPSDNLSAELLLKTVGAVVKGPPGTAHKGITVIKEMLAGWGLDTTRCRFADGSGVSRYNLVSPSLIVGLLQNMYADFSRRSEFIATLPVAGVDGTLRRRMRDTAAFGIVHAKTGTLSGVTTLSGYTRNRDGDVLAFSIMMSHYVGSASRYRRVQDRICDIVTRLQEGEQ